MAFIRTNDVQLGLKLETTEGTKIALTSADFIPVANPKFTPDIKFNELNKLTGSLSKSPGRPGMRSAKISFDYYLRGAATAAFTAGVEIGPALTACGFNEVLVAGTSATYAPATTVQANAKKSFTVEMQRGGKTYRIWGARGTVKISCKDGEPILCSFEFTGADFEEVVVAKTAGVTFSTVAEPIFFKDAGAMALTLGGTALVATALNIDMGNTVTLRQSISSASGNISAMITHRKPTISLDPEEVDDTTVLTAWKAGTTMALVAGPVGSTVGNKITITAPAVQYTGMSQSDRGGIATLSVNALCCLSAGDDEISIAFT